MAQSIIIIGAGMGGLAAGVYGQLNGFDTRIYEMHYRAGGQCASWQRSGYTFDACIHHLMGCAPGTRIHEIWRETGALPAELVYTQEMVSVASPTGKVFYDYYDLEKLEEHMLALAPQDGPAIREFIVGVRDLSRHDLAGALLSGSIWGLFKKLPVFLRNLKWFKLTMADYAQRFQDPFMQRAFPLLIYSNPNLPVFIHLMRHASGFNRDIAWPVGASAAFVDGMVRRYETLGGAIHYRKKVEKILTENGRAVGVKLADGSEEFADIVISDADGRRTLLGMLDGKFMDDRLRGYCAEPDDKTEFAVCVFLGVNRDLSGEPSSLIMLLDEPVTLAGHEFASLEMQLYGHDHTMAPAGKGVIKVELVSAYSYWKKLAANKEDYEAEKKLVTKRLIELLEKQFPGITGQVEVTDVITLLTWERFMGGTHGFANMPKKKPDFLGSFFSDKEMTIPGLQNFYFAGVWATSAGALFINANSGKKAIKKICQQEGRPFRSV